jgi:hypothetical protein
MCKSLHILELKVRILSIIACNIFFLSLFKFMFTEMGASAENCIASGLQCFVGNADRGILPPQRHEVSS